MGKIWTIAVREYRAMVATKAFMISVTVMPILMFGSIVAMQYLRKFDSVKDRTMKVIDGTGMLFNGLAKAAQQRNETMKSISEYVKASENEKEDETKQAVETKEPTDLSSENRLKKLRQSLRDRKLSHLKVELIDERPSPELRLRLSNEIRKGDLYAFVEIPATAFEVPKQKPGDLPKLSKFLKEQGLNILVLLASPKFEMKGGKTFFVFGNKSIELPDEEQREYVEAGLKVRARMEPVAFYSENPSFSDERNWLESTIHGLIQSERLKRSNISELAVKRASIKSPFKGMALVSRSADGVIQPGKEVDRLTAIFLPFGMMMLMFMVIFLAAQPMLESVIEEKTERIAEVLLG